MIVLMPMPTEVVGEVVVAKEVTMKSVTAGTGDCGILLLFRGTSHATTYSLDHDISAKNILSHTSCRPSR